MPMLLFIFENSIFKNLTFSRKYSSYLQKLAHVSLEPGKINYEPPITFMDLWLCPEHNLKNVVIAYLENETGKGCLI